MKGLEFSVVRYQVRKALDISISEYCLCDMVYHLAYNAENTLRYCYASKSTLAEELGITERGIFKMIERLEEMGLMERHEDRRMLRTTVKWQNAHFCSDYEQSSVSVGMNLVQPGHELSSVETMNLVHTNSKENNKKKNKGRVTASGDLFNDSKNEGKENQAKESAPPKPRFSQAEIEMMRHISALCGFESDPFKFALAGYIEMRRKAKKSLDTEHAAKVLANTLKRLGEQDAILSLDQSTLNKWQGVFEPRQPQAAASAGNNRQPSFVHTPAKDDAF